MRGSYSSAAASQRSASSTAAFGIEIRRMPAVEVAGTPWPAIAGSARPEAGSASVWRAIAQRLLDGRSRSSCSSRRSAVLALPLRWPA
jgi:hypothetical protein